MLSSSFWRREFEGRADVVGKKISLDNNPFEIAGVLEPGFTGMDVGAESDVYVPLCTGENHSRRIQLARPHRSSWWLESSASQRQGFQPSSPEARLKTLALADLRSHNAASNWKAG